MREHLSRYKQGIFIAISFAPFLSLKLFSAPLLYVIYYADFFIERLAALFAIQLAALGWILIQGNAVTGADFFKYIKTLPINSRVIYSVEIQMLFRANNLIWLIFLISVFSIPYSKWTNIDLLLSFFLIASISLSIIIFQFFWLYRINKLFYALLCIDLAICLVNEFFSNLTSVFLAVFVFLATLMITSPKFITKYAL
jgi:hypothetical protein